MKEKSSAPSECYCDAMEERRQCDAAGFCLMDRAVKMDATENRRWRHVSRDQIYDVVGCAALQNSREAVLQDDHVLVVYRGASGRLYARPFAEFHDGRFEEVK